MPTKNKVDPLNQHSRTIVQMVVVAGIDQEDHSTPEAVYSGADLMGAGLNIQLPNKYTSDLVYLEEAR